MTPEGDLIALAQAMLETIDPTPLYARADLLRLPAGSFAVMALELIEPAVFFRSDSAAPARSARARG